MNPYSNDTLIHAVYECLSAIEHKQMTKISVVDPLTMEAPDTKILRAALSKVGRKMNCKINTRTRNGVLFARKEKLPSRYALRQLATANKKKSISRQVSEVVGKLNPKDPLTINMDGLNLGTVRSAITNYSQTTGRTYITSVKADGNLFVRRIK